MSGPTILGITSMAVPVRAPGTRGMRRIVGIRDGRNRG
jgi:hypothetical protein